MANEGIVKSYLAGGLLIDNLETILVLNEMVKDNYESIKNDEGDILETEDKTEFAKEYSIEEEIQGLKEIISYLNDKNQFKKALIYQRRLVKLAREENIKPHREADLKQRTLSDF